MPAYCQKQDVNCNAVLGAITIGIGFSQLRRIVWQLWYTVHFTVDVQQTTKNIGGRFVDVDETGTPLVTDMVYGTWSKRSYGTNHWHFPELPWLLDTIHEMCYRRASKVKILNWKFEFEPDNIPDKLKKNCMFKNNSNIVAWTVFNAKSLPKNENSNIAEQFNSIMVKTNEAKRINFSLSQSYSNRVNVAVMQHSSGVISKK